MVPRETKPKKTIRTRLSFPSFAIGIMKPRIKKKYKKAR